MVQISLPLQLQVSALEGIDGCGKTTVFKRLQNDFQVGFSRACFTREPGGSVIGEKIRTLVLNDKDSEDESPLTRLLLFMSSRSSNVDKIIKPALQNGKMVISDRLDASTFAFQLWGGECQNLEKIFYFLRNQILGDLPIQYIYLRITPEIAAGRRVGRPESARNFLDDLPSDFHQRVFEGYELFFRRLAFEASRQENPLHTVHVVDASVSEDEVYQQVLSIVLRG
ncbi:MAG: dTMP kinase [Minisyncoccota bacterium]